jgi:hypothetical protein
MVGCMFHPRATVRMNDKLWYVQDQLTLIRRALERGQYRAKQGCVASELLEVFTYTLAELDRAHLALLEEIKGNYIDDSLA